MAKALQDDCQVLAGFEEASAKERVTGDNIVFKDKPNGNAVSRFLSVCEDIFCKIRI